MTPYEHMSLSLEGLVVVILIGEFVYDAWWNNTEQRRKRRKKQKPDFENLTTGEGK